jgi:hypothetical protein
MHARRRPAFVGYVCSSAFWAFALPALAEPPEGSAAIPLQPTPAASAVAPLDSKRRLFVTPHFARTAVRAALASARRSEAWTRLISLEARSHSSALLPELIFRGVRNTDQSLRFSPTVDEPNNYSAAGGAGWWFEARFIWHLDRLVFDTHELGIERLRTEHSDRTGKLVAKVLTTLFSWQRATLRAEDPKAAAEDQERAELDRAEAEILLDELTGGWFSAELARRPASE